MDMSSLFGEIPTGMIPLKQKPALRWIIDNLVKDGFNDFVISVGFKKEIIINYISNLSIPNVKISCAEVDYKKSPGSSIKQIATTTNNPNGLLVVLGDTLVFESIDTSEDAVYTSKDFFYPDQFSTVSSDENNYVKDIKEKDKSKTINDEALIGIYFFKNIDLLTKTFSEITDSSIQISQILSLYNKKQKMKIHCTDSWLDLGHLDKYYHSKVVLSQSRYFNSLEYDSLLGVITKRSQNKEKFRDEILWYQKLPNSLKSMAPRVLDYSVGDEPFVKMEYYSYPTLSELFIYSSHSIRLWEHIFFRLFKVISLFEENKHFVSGEDYQEMYYTKTMQRIDQAKNQSPLLQKLLAIENLNINQKEYLGLAQLHKFILQKCSDLAKNKDLNSCLIHGDLCFSNILFDVSSGIFRFLDPRGKWGSTEFGDLRYDLAKLRHSISGRYDFIVNDLFSISQSENNFEFKIYDSAIHSQISDLFDQYLEKKYDLNEIIFIEGLLFISMIPLHKDNFNRQKAMFCRGIQLLNQAQENA